MYGEQLIYKIEYRVRHIISRNLNINKLDEYL